MDDGACIKTNVNLREFEKCAADREPLGVIAKEQDATITRMGFDGKMQTIDANPGDKLYKGDIVTAEGGNLAISLRDNTVVTLGKGASVDMSTVNLREMPADNGVHRGSVSVISGKIAKATEGPVRFSYPGQAGAPRG